MTDRLLTPLALVALVAAGSPPALAQSPISSVDALYDALENGDTGDVVTLAAGVFELDRSLRPQSGMTIVGAGAGQTILRPTPEWSPGVEEFSEDKTDHSSADRAAYLFDLGTRTTDVTVAAVTLSGAGQLHGGLYCNDCDGLTVRDSRLEDFLWSGIRTWRVNDERVHDNEFHNAGGDGGGTSRGGALYQTWLADSEIWNNRITQDESGTGHFGIKGYQHRRTRIHHNTCELDRFCVELPHNNDHTVEIDHNAFSGPISIPKYAGGTVPEGGYTFRIHHNWITRSYALEWARNHAEVDHNLFDFDPDDDKGTLAADFGRVVSPGPTDFHDNLIKNPGRGIFWSRTGYDNFRFYNNHVIANPTATPRTEGLFGLGSETDYSTLVIRDNVIECVGLARDLIRGDSTRKRLSVVVNNLLVNVADAEEYDNPATGDPRGPLAPLRFTCGVDGEVTVDGWDAAPTPEAPAAFPAPERWYTFAAVGHGGLVVGTDADDGTGTSCGGAVALDVRGAAGAGDDPGAQWRFEPAAEGRYYVVNRLTGYRLQASGQAGPGPRTACGDESATLRLVDARCRGAYVQWDLLAAPTPGAYYLHNDQTDTHAQLVPEGGGSYLARLVPPSRCGGAWTQWTLADVGDVAARADRDDATADGLSAPDPSRAPAIFPNPTAGTLTIEGAGAGVAIHDALGRVVVDRVAAGAGDAVTVDLPPSLAPGVYFVRTAAGRAYPFRLTR